MFSIFRTSWSGRLLTVMTLIMCRVAGAQSGVQSIDVDAVSGVAAAVVVDGQALVHTTQLLPLDADGKAVGNDVATQVHQLIAQLSRVLQRSGSDLRRLVRLSVYARTNEVAQQARHAFAETLFQEIHPAVTAVVGTLPHADTLVAIDAVASLNGSDRRKLEYFRPDSALLDEPSLACVLPPGKVVYVSGMAARVDDLAQATSQTMEKLHGVLQFLELTPQQVVHLKAFMKPIGQADQARRIMASFYAGEKIPPMTFVEWKNGLPIEIEMIVFASADTGGAAVSQNWQPKEKRSPVFCRYAVVNAARRIYLSGLSSADSDPVEQSRHIFRTLDQLLGKCGSDLNHLAKATYYVTTGAASDGLNAVRPEFYDPSYPPAASKASVAGTGWSERSVTVDMIAVPRE